MKDRDIALLGLAAVVATPIIFGYTTAKSTSAATNALKTAGFSMVKSIADLGTATFDSLVYDFTSGFKPIASGFSKTTGGWTSTLFGWGNQSATTGGLKPFTFDDLLAYNKSSGGGGFK